MESSAQNIVAQVAAPASGEFVIDENMLASAEKELTTLGLFRCKQNRRLFKLLKETNGNVEVVKEFLIAKKKLHEAKLSIRKNGKVAKVGKEERRKAKLDKKRDREAEKLARKELKKAGHRLGGHHLHQQRRHGHGEEKNQEEKMIKKENRRQHQEDSQAVEERTLSSLSIWPPQVTRLYLDGNNMLFVAAPVRQKAIHGQMDTAGIILSSVAFEMSKLLPENVKTTVVFDNGSRRVTQSYHNQRFDILIARPTFQTSDDALVEWCKENAQANVHSMVVTSDRGLKQRLAELPGVILVKPKTWMQHAAAVLDQRMKNSDSPATTTDPEKIQLDDWMNQWIQKMETDAHQQMQMQIENLNVSNAN